MGYDHFFVQSDKKHQLKTLVLENRLLSLNLASALGIMFHKERQVRINGSWVRVGGCNIKEFIDCDAFSMFAAFVMFISFLLDKHSLQRLVFSVHVYSTNNLLGSLQHCQRLLCLV